MALSETEIVLAANKCVEHLREFGISTHQHQKPKRLKRSYKKITGRSSSGQFDKDRRVFLPSNSLFFEWQYKNKPIGVHALHFRQYGGTCLAESWNSGEQVVAYQGGKTGKNHPPLAYQMTGGICYSGEYVLHVSYRADNLISSAQALYSFMIARLRFNPDWIYGFMSRSNVQRGFAARAGFHQIYAMGTDWKTPPSGIDPQDYLVAMDSQTLDWNIRLIAKHGLAALLETR